MNVKKPGLYLCTTYKGMGDKKIQKVLCLKWYWEDVDEVTYKRKCLLWHELIGNEFSSQWVWKVVKAKKLPM